MSEKTTSRLAKALVGGTDSHQEMMKQFAMHFSTYAAIVNLKMVAMLNDKMTNGDEPADEFVEAVLEGWKDASIKSFEAEMVEYADLMEDPLAGLLGGALPNKESLKETYMNSLEEFYNQIEKAVK